MEKGLRFLFFLGLFACFLSDFHQEGEGHFTSLKFTHPTSKRAPYHISDTISIHSTPSHPIHAVTGRGAGLLGFFLGGATGPKTRKDFVWPPSAFSEGRCVTVTIFCPVHSPGDIPPPFHAHVCCVRMGSSSCVAWAVGGRGLLRCVVVVVGWD